MHELAIRTALDKCLAWTNVSKNNAYPRDQFYFARHWGHEKFLYFSVDPDPYWYREEWPGWLSCPWSQNNGACNFLCYDLSCQHSRKTEFLNKSSEKILTARIKLEQWNSDDHNQTKEKSSLQEHDDLANSKCKIF